MSNFRSLEPSPVRAGGDPVLIIAHCRRPCRARASDGAGWLATITIEPPRAGADRILREVDVVTTSTAEPYVPATDQLPELAGAAAGCRGCELYQDATQTVFGRGPATAPMMLVGEQPGDVEDQRGEPFVGPAGKLLDRALADAGIDPGRSYLTNAVKHFAFTRRGTRRLHQTPKRGHIVACRPWLAAELRVVRPQVLVALGATASQSLFGPSFRLSQHRGEVLHLPHDDSVAGGEVDPLVVVTIHPSAVLRAGEARDDMYGGLVADLQRAAALLP